MQSATGDRQVLQNSSMVVDPFFLGGEVVEIKISATRCADFKAKMHRDSISAWSTPQTPLESGELTALPRLLAGFKGSYF